MFGALTPGLSPDAAATGENPSPLDADGFAALLRPFLPLSQPVALAVSGGPDSLALALAVARLGLPAVGLIVDHALRDGSADEAEQARAELKYLGIPAEILTWRHGGVHARLHERARTARYALLIDGCRRFGATDLLLGHHRDDQAETILMRLQKDSGPRGLAGMRPASLRDGIRLLRPLLTVPRAVLATGCAEAGLNPITDPANADPRFERGRLRATEAMTAQGLSVDSVIALGEAARAVADAQDEATDILLARFGRIETGGVIHLERAGLCEASEDTARDALARCLRLIGGGYPPPRAAVAHLLDLVRNEGRDAANPHRAATHSLHGCLIVLGREVQILREASATARQAFTGGTVMWDGRWRVTLNGSVSDACHLAALGNPPHDLLDTLASGLRRAVPQGRVRAALPGLWHDKVLIAIPSLGGDAPFTCRPTLTSLMLPSLISDGPSTD